MAIEIVPKKETKLQLWVIIVFIVSLIGIIVLVAGYFYLGQLIKELAAKRENIEKSLIKTPAEKALEDKLLLTEKKINDFTGLLSNHHNIVNIFTILEKSTHPKVWFSSFSFNRNGDLVDLKGEAESFVILGQQIYILKSQPLFKNINLSDVSMGEKKKINFSLQITIDPQIYK